MSNILINVILITTSLLAGYAQATEIEALPHGQVRFEQCLAAALARQPGRVVKVEFKRKAGALVYEFDLRDDQGNDWDIECDADSGAILGVEREVPAPQHPLFRAVQRISEQQARGIALEAFPGEIVETEYEVQEDGSARFEFDIATADGREMKVEVDAASGAIVEASEELWQVGFE